MAVNEPIDPRVRLAISQWPDDAPRGAVSTFCAEHGISRKSFYDLRQRAKTDGPAAVLEPRTRRPRTSPSKLTDEVKEQATQVRAALEASGLDHGPISVHDKMRAMGLDLVPSTASLARIFRGARPTRRPPARCARGPAHESALVAGQLRQTEYVTEVRPAANADPARWLLRPDVDWWDLVRYGPPGFEVYVRIALADGADREGEEPALRTALATLAGHTTTPAIGYAAIWEGWTSREPAPRAPRVAIPHRAMLLFTGRVDELRDAPALAWYGSAQGVFQEPHLVWPEDQAWCLACEVDEEIEFTVGCSIDAAQALSTASPGTVRRVRYGAPAPMYRD